MAFIAAFTSYVFLRIVDLPYALALAVFVGLLDLIPLVGATIAAVVVSLLGFTESVGVGHRLRRSSTSPTSSSRTTSSTRT